MAADWSSHTEAPLSINSSSPSREMLTHSWVSIIPEKKIPHQGAGTGPGSGEPAISPPPHLQMGSGTGTQGLPSSCHVFLPISSLLPFKKKKKTISIFCHPSPVRAQLQQPDHNHNRAQETARPALANLTSSCAAGCLTASSSNLSKTQPTSHITEGTVKHQRIPVSNSAIYILI